MNKFVDLKYVELKEWRMIRRGRNISSNMDLIGQSNREQQSLDKECWKQSRIIRKSMLDNMPRTNNSNAVESSENEKIC